MQKKYRIQIERGLRGQLVGFTLRHPNGYWIGQTLFNTQADAMRHFTKWVLPRISKMPPEMQKILYNI